jgi:hypothetical protein
LLDKAIAALLLENGWGVPPAVFFFASNGKRLGYHPRWRWWPCPRCLFFFHLNALKVNAMNGGGAAPDAGRRSAVCRPPKLRL